MKIDSPEKMIPIFTAAYPLWNMFRRYSVVRNVMDKLGGLFLLKSNRLLMKDYISQLSVVFREISGRD